MSMVGMVGYSLDLHTALAIRTYADPVYTMSSSVDFNKAHHTSNVVRYGRRRLPSRTLIIATIPGEPAQLPQHVCHWQKLLICRESHP